jgi:hypothetical protein
LREFYLDLDKNGMGWEMAEGRNEKGPKYKYYTFGRLYYNGAVPILTSDAQTAQQSASALLNFCSSNIMTIDSPCRYDDE